MATTSDVYRDRINTVIQYLNNNLDKSHRLEELAKVSCFSPYHFHRIFMAATGETVNNYTNRLRIEKAARLLKYSAQSIQDISYSCGFSTSAVFSRAFKQHIGSSPTRFRKDGSVENSKIRKELYAITAHIEDRTIEELESKFPVTIKSVDERHIAYIRIIDSFREGVVIAAFQRLIQWSQLNGLYDNATFFGMSLDDPFVTPHKKYRYEACVTIPSIMDINDPEIFSTTLPSCLYACTKAIGDINEVTTANNYLFNHWLTSSKYEPEHLPGQEIFLDKSNVCNWEHFELELCIPIKPINH